MDFAHCPNEIVIYILEHLAHVDLCACLRVCNRWYQLGIDILYKTLRFDNHKDFSENRLQLFLQLLNLLLKKRYLMDLIREIHITMHRYPKEISGRGAIATFAERVCRVIGSARNIRYVEVNEKCLDLKRDDIGRIDDVLAALLASKVPRIGISLGEGQHSDRFYRLVKGLGEKQLSYLTISASGIPPTFFIESLRFFPHLARLTIRPSPLVSMTILNFNWGEILSNSSLEELSLGTSEVQCLPKHIETLELIGGECQLLPNTWKVICSLERLIDLRLVYSQISQMQSLVDKVIDDLEYTDDFKSKNLRHFMLRSKPSDQSNLVRVWRPILFSCKHLRSIFLEINGIIRQDLLLDLSSLKELSQVDIYASKSDYALDDVVSAAQNWPRLESLKLPFPQSNLEGATLKQYNVLSSSCTKLRELVFSLPVGWDHPFSVWRDDLKRSDPTIDYSSHDYRDSLDKRFHKYFNRRAEIYQKYNKAHLVPRDSPCLGHCTILEIHETNPMKGRLHVYMDEVQIFKAHMYIP